MIKYEAIDDLTFEVTTRYAKGTFDKRKTWRNRPFALEFVPEETINEALKTLDPSMFVETTMSTTCIRVNDRTMPDRIRTSYSGNPELLDLYATEETCGKTALKTWYAGSRTYQSEIDAAVFIFWMQSIYPDLLELFKVSFYEFSDFPEAYIKNRDNSGESLYVPLETFKKKQWQIAVNRMLDYNKKTKYCDYNSFKEDPHAVLVAAIVEHREMPEDSLKIVRAICLRVDEAELAKKEEVLQALIEKKTKAILELTTEIEEMRTTLTV